MTEPFKPENLKKIKVGELDKESLTRIEEIYSSISAKIVIDPEKTLYQLYVQLKEEEKKQKKEQKQLEEAKDMILSIGFLYVNKGREGEGQGLPRLRVHKDEQHTLHTKVSIQSPIQRNESLQLLEDGSRKHRRKRVEHEIEKGPLEEAKEYDTVLLICADAREKIVDFNVQANNDVLVLRVAGNVHDKSKARSVETALKRLRKGGQIIVIGHEKGGAVHACHDVHEKGERSPYVGISPSVSRLVDTVDIHKVEGATNDNEANAINQAKRLESNGIVRKNEIKVSAAVFDIETGKMKYLGKGEKPEIVEQLEKAGEMSVVDAKTKGYDLKKQYSHAIVVVADPEKFGRFNDPSTLFDAGSNELFIVNSDGQKVSKCAIASIEYALANVNGVRDNPHIVVMATNSQIASILLDNLKSESRIIEEAIKTGAVTFAVYTPTSGIVEFQSQS